MILDTRGRRWYRGNLHTHTTRSDGGYTPEEAIALYRGHGYDFLALTDHWVMGETREAEDFLLLSGCEYDAGEEVCTGIYHIVGVGMETDPVGKKHVASAQELIDAIHAADGLAILAHPAWSMNRAEEICRLHGLDGCEIYNSTSRLPWNCRPYSGVILDEMASRGSFVGCMAADDAHWYKGDETRSYLWVQADALNRVSILEAIRAGRFYASQGPRFEMERIGEEIRVRSTPAQSIVFFTDTLYVPDRAVCGPAVCEAAYRIKPSDSFVRVEVTDALGNMAWSSFVRV